MSDPVVFIFFPNPQVIRVGPVRVGFDQAALFSFGAWTIGVELSLPFLLWLSVHVLGLCTFIYQDGYFVLDSYYGFVM